MHESEVKNMAYRVHQYNKKNGTTYVYEGVSTWDKEKKAPTNKQICIGKLDKGTGEFIPSKRLRPEQAAARDPDVTATSFVVGPSMVLDQVTSAIGLIPILKKAFPDTYKELLTLAYFITQKGNALSHCENWGKGHECPAGYPLVSQRISGLLAEQTEGGRQAFFKEWIKGKGGDSYCYDITSISSYSELNEYVKYGYNRDGGGLPQINLAMLIGQESKLPVCYNRMPGSISDVKTISHFLEIIGKINAGKLHFVLDRGFYSKDNIDALFEKRHKFTIAVSNHIKWVQNVIDEFRDGIEGPKYYHKVGTETLYMATKLYNWSGKRSYAHVYFNSYRAAETFDNFTEKLLSYRDELVSGKLVKKHEEYYKRYFVITDTPRRGRKVEFNDAEIQKYRNRYAGFYVILTNESKGPLEVLKTYRDKDVVENCFDDLKSQIDMKRFRVHRSAAMDGRLFIQFLALIYISAIRKTISESENKTVRNYTVRELLGEMDSLSRITYSGKYGSLLTVISKQQRLILEAFGIPLS
jgi:transposase